MAHRYLIDGYNVLYKSRALRPLVDRSLEVAREALIDKVAEFSSQSGDLCVVYFDGRSQARTMVEADHGRKVANLRVIYTPHNLTADAMIEREVYQTHQRLSVVVVSNDSGIRGLVRGMGALTMDADNFLATMHETRQDIAQTITTKKAHEPMGRIEGRLGSDALDRLEALKKRLGG